jgi:deazaflavin-dependent oxidoreductase (nitroreductase family)
VRARITNLLSRPRRLATTATRLHARLLRATRGRVGSRNPIAPRQRLLALTTTGRRSGAERASAVGYLEDGDNVVVVASNAGLDRPPAWWLNLEQDPDAEIDLQGERRAVRARRASPDERDRLWPRVVAQFGGFESYDRYTEREIPLVVLEPRRPP